MFASTKSDAKRVIDAIQMAPLIKKALEHKTLRAEQVDAAVAEYKQFLLLIWVNHVLDEKEVVVPTERADQLWHEHILFTKEYRTFCDALIGRFVDHMPGLEKGSQPFSKAVEHTRKLHTQHGGDGYSPGYLAGCGGVVAPAPTGECPAPVSDGGCPPAASCGGASCGGSCGGGCGGGGCGGG